MSQDKTRCTGPCGATLPKSAFHKDSTRPRGVKTKCRACYKTGRLAREDAAGRLEVVGPVEEHRLKKRCSELQAQVSNLTSLLSDARAMNDVVAQAQARKVAPIVPRERRSGLLEGTCQVLASDWHVEEEVRPEQVAGRNRYDLAISRKRMTRFFESITWALGFNRQAFKVRDLVLGLLGDFITNHLHPDNVETNLLSPPQALAYVKTNISAGIRTLLSDPELERIVIPCVDGNHDRTTDKMRSANRTPMSLATMMYGLLADEFASEKRVQFIIAEGSHLYYDVYGRTIRYTHGDETRYGGGIGGITIPIYKAMSRWDTVRRSDLTCLGHYHQHTSLSDLIINGSLIGMTAYSLSIGARFEPPCQNLTMLDPKRFKGLSMPLWVSDREDDRGQK